jgi:hypothetical protein
MVVGSTHPSNINHLLVQKRDKIPQSETSDRSYQQISDESTISRQEHLGRLLLLLLPADGPWLELLVYLHLAPECHSMCSIVNRWNIAIELVQIKNNVCDKIVYYLHPCIFNVIW